MTAFQSLVTELSPALTSFVKSQAAFKIIKTIPSPSHGLMTSSATTGSNARTLFILDSSFNPPTKAHLSILSSALTSDVVTRHPSPYRVLLLFSTHNADKAPSAATFDQRLALMTLLAQDLHQCDPSGRMDIDIGLTTAPYYTDKSSAITASKLPFYQSSMQHVHLLGYDTLTRFFAAKYYTARSPPLSALNSLFDAGHRLRVTLRPDDGYGSVAEQQRFIDGIADGKLESEGGRREWAGQIETDAACKGVGISSTRVRNAAKEQKWNIVTRLCTERVAQAIQEAGIYD